MRPRVVAGAHPLRLFALKHSITFKCDAYSDARDIEDRLHKLLTRTTFKIKGSNIRVSAQRAAAQRRACAKYCGLLQEFRLHS